MKIITDTEKTAKEKGIKIRLIEEKTIIPEGEKMPTNGYFCSETKVLAVATGKPKEDWLPIFIHESCHMDQFFENSFLWDKWNVGYTLFFEWIEGKEVDKKTLLLCFKDIIDCEKDCEQRTVKKMKKYRLKIDTSHYTQMANLYLYSYAYILKARKWKKGLYKNEPLAALCPKVFQDEYLIIPAALKIKFKQFYGI